MTRQVINRGTTANDGTGDTLRSAGLKIEQNFQEIYEKLGGDSSVLMPKVSFDSDHLILNGNIWDTKIGKEEPTSDNTILFPDFTGEVTVDSATQTIANKTVLTTTLVQPYIAESADAVHTFHVHALPLSQYTDIYLPSLTDSDEFTFNDHTQTLNNKTINAPMLNNPKIGTELQDSAGNQLIEFISTPGAVNHFKITNQTNNNTPVFEAVGTDADIDLGLKAKGEGGVEIQSKLKLGYQIMTSNGAVDVNVPLTFFNAGGALTITMPDGAERGEIKYLVNQNSGTATITPANLQNFSTITLPVNHSCTLVWDTAEWIVINTGIDSAGAILS
jgi:uncharacterized protein YdeI (BOF family)